MKASQSTLDIYRSFAGFSHITLFFPSIIFGVYSNNLKSYSCFPLLFLFTHFLIFNLDNQDTHVVFRMSKISGKKNSKI